MCGKITGKTNANDHDNRKAKPPPLCQVTTVIPMT